MDQETKDMASGQLVTTMHSPVRMDALLGLVTGFAGGLLAKAALDSWTRRDLLLAALFGLVFGLLFSRRTDSPGLGSSGALVLHFWCGLRSRLVSAPYFPDLALRAVCSAPPKISSRRWRPTSL